MQSLFHYLENKSEENFSDLERLAHYIYSEHIPWKKLIEYLKEKEESKQEENKKSSIELLKKTEIDKKIEEKYKEWSFYFKGRRAGRLFGYNKRFVSSHEIL